MKNIWILAIVAFLCASSHAEEYTYDVPIAVAKKFLDDRGLCYLAVGAQSNLHKDRIFRNVYCVADYGGNPNSVNSAKTCTLIVVDLIAGTYTGTFMGSYFIKTSRSCLDGGQEELARKPIFSYSDSKGYSLGYALKSGIFLKQEGKKDTPNTVFLLASEPRFKTYFDTLSASPKFISIKTQKQ